MIFKMLAECGFALSRRAGGRRAGKFKPFVAQ
jgi:hypothetical protein